MNLGFKPEFKDKILSGTKIHTIRLDKTDRWKVDRKIHFCTGNQTKNYNCFKLGEVKQCVQIKMVLRETDLPVGVYLKKDGELYPMFLTFNEVFANKDGFYNFEKMMEWFRSQHKEDVIDCKLITWIEGVDLNGYFSPIKNS